ncbi:Septum site-determining protein MinC [Clarias magur]|uniref:Septum site-determining protein MinC n=1 Tax=Clarias magur TaxID=1594786 RepID=A0A8J4UE19_CLAMG|nr:Septum site-determining protein MinC [Clarias magur]
MSGSQEAQAEIRKLGLPVLSSSKLGVKERQNQTWRSNKRRELYEMETRTEGGIVNRMGEDG